ncbi:MAG: hypothetical protein ACYC6Y_31665 [Thermoguttaceae bacterium]
MGGSGGLGGIGASDLSGLGGVYVDGGYSYPFRASTPGESFARGRADIIRAQGEFNRLSSEAAINAQQARSGAIANAKDGVEAYFRIREMNRDYRKAERGPRPTPEDFERYSRAGRPIPLSPSELDTLTGRVRWPVLLRDEHFAAWRAEIEDLLDRWAVSRNLGQPATFGTEQHLAVRQAIGQMEEQLRVAVRNLHPQDYSASQRFLDSLEYQVLHNPTSSETLADIR